LWLEQLVAIKGAVEFVATVPVALKEAVEFAGRMADTHEKINGVTSYHSSSHHERSSRIDCY
jgi:hypothetical protein